MLGLLEEVHDMEAMRASLLRVTATQANAAGVAAGAEDAGLRDLVALIEQERSAAADQRDQLRAQLLALHHRPSRVHAFETFAAARATALVEHIRSYRLVRDIRDLLAASQLETASYTLLARAAERADDPDTATLAQRLRIRERTAAERLGAELDSALEIALLGE
jgi:ferritin-like metal-binding protein YciE